MSTILVFFLSLIFTFSFWRKLKEDYLSTQIFNTSFFVIIGILLGLLIPKYLFIPIFGSKASLAESGIYFWLAVVGGMAGFLFAYLRVKFRFLETFEAFGVSFLLCFSLWVLSHAITNQSINSLLYSLVLGLLIMVFTFLDKKYKKFTWYKSGKVGFAGLTTFGVFFLVRALIALPFPFVLSFLGRIESIVSSIIAFVFFLALYNLLQQKA